LAAGADYVGLDDTYKNQRWLDWCWCNHHNASVMGKLGPLGRI
jgi:hypothetical protein